MSIDLRLGDWRTTMADVECDAMITDPPYSARTDAGFIGSGGPDNHVEFGKDIGYRPIDEEYVSAFVSSWAPRVRSWWVVFGDHITNAWWLRAMDAAGLVAFAPVVWVKGSSCPRFTGDGPASQVEWLAIARTRGAWATSPPWGSLPGFYLAERVRHGHGHGHVGVTGAKPVDLMRVIVRDYTRPGWTVADPHCGSGTTALACRAEGRACTTSELDPNTYEIAKRRIEAPAARPLFDGVGAA